MGIFFSAPDMQEDSGAESNVIAVHSKDRFDEQFLAHKNANKMVLCFVVVGFCS
jgi:hypothetical protein